MPITVTSEGTLAVNSSTITANEGFNVASNLVHTDELDELKAEVGILDGRIESLSARIDQIESIVRKLKGAF
jgi:chromosome segregation ATPase